MTRKVTNPYFKDLGKCQFKDCKTKASSFFHGKRVCSIHFRLLCKAQKLRSGQEKEQ